MIAKHIAPTCLLLGGLLSQTAAAGDGAALLLASPGKCVTMKQGQLCYQDISLKWQTVQTGDYCLFLEGSDQALHCWQQAGTGEFEHEFARRESSRYQLRRGDSDEVIGEAVVTVKWVYQRRSNHGFGWRVF